MERYERGFKSDRLYSVSVTGIVTARDHLAIDYTANELSYKIGHFVDENQSDDAIRQRFFSHKKPGKFLPGDSRGWSLSDARRKLKDQDYEQKFEDIGYRPFDTRKILYSTDLIDWGREAFYRSIRPTENLSFVTVSKQLQSKPTSYYFLASAMVSNGYIRSDSVSIDSIFPLYSYPDDSSVQTDTLASKERKINFDPKLFAAICEAAGIDPTDQAGREDDFRAPTGDARPSEIKVFDYIYGVLHSPDYRETFAEFLKIDFPRIPYPPSPAIFRHVSEKGEALRRLHLMEDAAVGETPYPYHGEGDDVVAARHPRFEDGRVYINPDQFFDGVPKVAWDFYIGGYQPAQKWLKDRKDRALSWDDIGHYQKIVKILLETDRIMREIELPLDLEAEG
nr:type ISP restriction/modification enzyme [Sphingomicrobium astaxanthinifaciens]